MCNEAIKTSLKIQAFIIESELMAHLIRASLPGLCRTVRRRFEHYSDHKLGFTTVDLRCTP